MFASGARYRGLAPGAAGAGADRALTLLADRAIAPEPSVRLPVNVRGALCMPPRAKDATTGAVQAESNRRRRLTPLLWLSFDMPHPRKRIVLVNAR